MSTPEPGREDGDRAGQPSGAAVEVPAGPLTHLAVGLAVTALGLATLVGALDLGVGSAARPGSGMWPLLIGLALALLGVALSIRAAITDDAERFTRTSALVVAGLATMLGFVAVIGTVGFELPSLALMALWLRGLGGETWRSTALISVVTVVVLYALFVGALAVPIPHLF
ncbi:tripartite tricarboxylate transporter TctB family protein [Kineosporia succinea]|uniref:DUF1468 domain-containing protein n=1 Tax=Kineosporia succinea TaxID=84632 RepID=A0ABT9PDF6_9ACTN|nr:tripartite tricarboxylate transporter TctB family protein [Kineosporia succinea]MDP9830015.1 hypothetical protein [Kineosporia succinea]